MFCSRIDRVDVLRFECQWSNAHTSLSGYVSNDYIEAKILVSGNLIVTRMMTPQFLSDTC